MASYLSAYKCCITINKPENVRKYPSRSNVI